jgi:hypothetical protein
MLANVTIYSNVPSGSNYKLRNGITGGTSIYSESGIQIGYTASVNSKYQFECRLSTHMTNLFHGSFILYVVGGNSFVGRIENIAYMNENACSVRFIEDAWYTCLANGITPNIEGIIERSNVLYNESFGSTPEPFSPSDYSFNAAPLAIQINNAINILEGGGAWRFLITISSKLKYFLDLQLGGVTPYQLDVTISPNFNTTTADFFALDVTSDLYIHGTELLNGFPLLFSSISALRAFVTNVSQSGLAQIVADNIPMVNIEGGYYTLEELARSTQTFISGGSGIFNPFNSTRFSRPSQSYIVDDETTNFNFGGGSGNASNPAGTLDVDIPPNNVYEVSKANFPTKSDFGDFMSFTHFSNDDILSISWVPPNLGIGGQGAGIATQDIVVNVNYTSNTPSGLHPKLYGYPYRYFTINSIRGGSINVIPQRHYTNANGESYVPISNNFTVQLRLVGGLLPKLLMRVNVGEGSGNESINNDEWILIKEYPVFDNNFSSSYAELMTSLRNNGLVYENARDVIRNGLPHLYTTKVTSGMLTGASTGSSLGNITNFPLFGEKAQLYSTLIGAGLGAASGALESVLVHNKNIGEAGLARNLQDSLAVSNTSSTAGSITYKNSDFWTIFTPSPIFVWERGSPVTEKYMFDEYLQEFGVILNNYGGIDNRSMPNDYLGLGSNSRGRQFYKFNNVFMSNVPERYTDELTALFTAGVHLID